MCLERKDILLRKEDILKWVKQKRTKAYICKQLKCKQSTLNKYLDIMEIEYKGMQGVGFMQNRPNTYVPLAIYIQRESAHSDKIKYKLIREGYKEHKCEYCNRTTWNGKPIPLELHHKDGNCWNNTVENFKLLCPNCHAFTDNYRGRNLKKEKTRNKENIKTKTKTKTEKNNNKRNCKDKKINYCVDCGIQISDSAKRCVSCARKLQKRKVENRPSREELKNLIRNHPFIYIGEMYGLSDNAIRKWCKSYGLPFKPTVIKKISDEDWEII